MSRLRNALGTVLVAMAVCAAVAGCGGGGSGAPAAASEVLAVTSSAGASSCDDSGFALIDKATGDHAEIYDCHFDAQGAYGANEECVTYTNGIADNATAEVRLAFSTALNGRPSCLG